MEDLAAVKIFPDAGDALSILASSEDTLEGMTAFKEKRKPEWKGR